MKTIASFGTDKITLTTKKLKRTVHGVSKMGQFFSQDDYDVEVIGWGDKISNWIYDRFNDNDAICVEIRIEKQRKLVLTKAHIMRFRPIISDTQLVFVTATVIAEQCELKDGLVGCPDVWSVS